MNQAVRVFKVKQIHLFQIVEGKIVEHQGVRDDFEMFRQLGLLAEVATQNQAQ
jgi:predicted ester cyclase